MRNINTNSGISDAYPSELSKVEILSHDEFLKFLIEAKSGSKEALEKCTKSYLRFVVSIASRFLHRKGKLDLEDLIQAGNIGLTEALWRFSDEYDCHFTTYAYWFIQKEIINCIDNQSRTVRIPNSTQKALGDLHWYHSGDLAAKLGRDPTEEEIVESYTKISGKKERRVRELFELKNCRFTSSIYENFGPNEITLEETLTSDEPGSCEFEEQVLKKIEAETIIKIANQLPKRQKKVLEMRLKNMTLEEIGKKVGLTKEGVRQIEKKAVRSLIGIIGENKA
ncbi:sigma-70 family RNA polymerase sigma factor [Candidatus Peregrinibacteria bacterium]|nr:sigma-70 family RNA polymerase sigma factor [Candidatus Peregrinibacteria bacterium]